MPAFEALFCATHPSIPHLQPHPGLILHHGHSPRGPQEYLGCPPMETLHYCWVTLVVFSSVCSDWTYAGHHLLCPLLMAMLAKLWSQTEWTFPPETRLPLHPSTNPPVWTLRHWRIWSELPQAREEGGTVRLRPPQEHGMKGYSSWDFLFLIYAVIDEDENW